MQKDNESIKKLFRFIKFTVLLFVLLGTFMPKVLSWVEKMKKSGTLNIFWFYIMILIFVIIILVWIKLLSKLLSGMLKSLKNSENPSLYGHDVVIGSPPQSFDQDQFDVTSDDQSSYDKGPVGG